MAAPLTEDEYLDLCKQTMHGPLPAETQMRLLATIDQMRLQRDRWEDIALWLADCHAATTSHEGMLKKTSKSSRDRFLNICKSAANFLEFGDRPYHRGRDATAVVKRLRDILKDSGV